MRGRGDEKVVVVVVKGMGEGRESGTEDVMLC